MKSLGISCTVAKKLIKVGLLAICEEDVCRLWFSKMSPQINEMYNSMM